MFGSAKPDEYGWVYILTNPAMPGVAKIGFTLGDPRERARELSTPTGVAVAFRLMYAVEVPDAHGVEMHVHRQLEALRVSPNREFFRCSVELAKQRLDECAGGRVRREFSHPDADVPVFVISGRNAIFCPKCGQPIDVFGSVLCDRRTGVGRCAWCNEAVKFRVLPVLASTPPVPDDTYDYKCPCCGTLTLNMPRSARWCPACKPPGKRP